MAWRLLHICTKKQELGRERKLEFVDKTGNYEVSIYVDEIEVGKSSKKLSDDTYMWQEKETFINVHKFN